MIGIKRSKRNKRRDQNLPSSTEKFPIQIEVQHNGINDKQQKQHPMNGTNKLRAFRYVKHIFERHRYEN